MFGRSDVPLRDLLVGLIAGSFGTLYVWWLARLMHVSILGAAEAGAPVVLLCVVAIGFLMYTARCHSRIPPWRARWEGILDVIIRELVAITGESLFEAEMNSRPIYKLWVETECAPEKKGSSGKSGVR